MEVNKITERILGCAFKVHTELGPGLLENAYEECLYYELKKSGLKVEKQKGLPLVYYDVKLDTGYRIDLLVEEIVVVEIKAVELTYLKLSKCKIGLLINFNVSSLKKGIKRLIK